MSKLVLSKIRLRQPAKQLWQGNFPASLCSTFMTTIRPDAQNKSIQQSKATPI